MNSKNLDDLLRPIIESMGYEVVDIRLSGSAGRYNLQILADKPGGITLDECARISREISPHLEVRDPIPGAYTLEVSSPGIRRPLTKKEHYERFAGQKVDLRAKNPIEGRKHFNGVNLGLNENGDVRILLEGVEGETLISFSNILSAKLDPEIKI